MLHTLSCSSGHCKCRLSSAFSVGREVKTLWESEELQNEFHLSIGRRRTPSLTRGAPAASDVKDPQGPASRIETDWQDWLRRYEAPKGEFSPPLPSNNQKRGRRRRSSEGENVMGRHRAISSFFTHPNVFCSLQDGGFHRAFSFYRHASVAS